MGQAQITQIPVGTFAVLAWSGTPNSEDFVTLVNRDINNTVYVGFTNTVSVNNSLPIDPNGSYQLPAKNSLWVIGAVQGITPLVVIPCPASPFRGITQGVGKLVIPQIQSPNYVPGVSGWAIFKNGNVEFNSGTFRSNVIFSTGYISNGDGTLTNKPGIFLYSGTPAAGNMIQCVTNAAGSDHFGNTFPSGTTTFDVISGNCMSIDQGQIIYYTGSAPQPGTTFSINLELFQSLSGSRLGFLTFAAQTALSLDTNGILQLQPQGDSNTYKAGKFTNVVGLTHITSTTPQLINRVNVATGLTYHYKVTCLYVGLQAAGAPVFTHGGTATFSHVKGWTQFGFDATTVGVFPDQTTLPSRTGPTLGLGNTKYTEEFWITCNGSGTIDFSGNDSIATDNWDALQTFVELEVI